MFVIAAPAAALAWLGGQGTRALAMSLIIGILVPQLAAYCKPLFTASLVLLLCLAFLRVEPRAVRAHFTRPGLLLASIVWQMLFTPALLGVVFLAFGKPEDGLSIALTLQNAAPPMFSTPAVAAMLGFDAALALASLLGTVAITPFTTPIFVALLLGDDFALAPWALGLRLFMIVAGAALVALAIRRVAGNAWVERQQLRIDGVAVIALFVFAVALMDGVLDRILHEPLLLLAILALACAVTLVTAALTAVIFVRAGRASAFALGLGCGNRNMGLMLAAAAGSLPDLTWLYFAMAQFPMYVLPHLIKPLAHRLMGAGIVTTEAGRP